MTINKGLNRKNYLEKENQLLRKEITLADSIGGCYKMMLVKQDSVVGYMTKKVQLAEECSVQLDNLLQNYIKKNRQKSRKRIVGVGVGGITLGLIVGALLK